LEKGGDSTHVAKEGDLHFFSRQGKEGGVLYPLPREKGGKFLVEGEGGEGLDGFDLGAGNKEKREKKRAPLKKKKKEGRVGLKNWRGTGGKGFFSCKKKKRRPKREAWRLQEGGEEKVDDPALGRGKGSLATGKNVARAGNGGMRRKRKKERFSPLWDRRGERTYWERGKGGWVGKKEIRFSSLGREKKKRNKTGWHENEDRKGW